MTAAAFIQRLPRLSLKERCLLFEMLGDNLNETSCSIIEDILGRKYSPGEKFRSLFEDVCRETEWLCSHGGGIAAYPEYTYPRLLREIYDPPFALYFRGVMPDTKEDFVAVVGTRRPNGRGARSAFELGESLGRAGITVVSGLARGIDRQAHAGNVAGGSSSLAVLGSGIAEVGPASSRPVAERLLATGGALVSEYPVFSHAMRHHFPMRNRIISGMSRCTVVVQAPRRSGALITADYALDQGREVMVHADCLQPGVGEGCRTLAEEGARQVRYAEDILQDWCGVWEKPLSQYQAVAV